MIGRLAVVASSRIFRTPRYFRANATRPADIASNSGLAVANYTRLWPYRRVDQFMPGRLPA